MIQQPSTSWRKDSQERKKSLWIHHPRHVVDKRTPEGNIVNRKFAREPMPQMSMSWPHAGSLILWIPTVEEVSLNLAEGQFCSLLKPRLFSVQLFVLPCLPGSAHCQRRMSDRVAAVAASETRSGGNPGGGLFRKLTLALFRKERVEHERRDAEMGIHARLTESSTER